MTTPPKAPCHSCNGTGIDPTVGFLDCEFCTPAATGVSLSAPEQPEPKCATCNDHGEIGCLRPDGYDGEQCPDCNPVTAAEELDAVLHWRGKHAVAIKERDALQQRLTAADERVGVLDGLSVTKILLDIVPGDGSGHEVYAKSVADVEGALTRSWRKVDALEDQVSALKGVLRDIRQGCELSKLRDAQIDEMLKP